MHEGIDYLSVEFHFPYRRIEGCAVQCNCFGPIVKRVEAMNLFHDSSPDFSPFITEAGIFQASGIYEACARRWAKFHRCGQVVQEEQIEGNFSSMMQLILPSPLSSSAIFDNSYAINGSVRAHQEK
jgi:hypothetical protein